MMTMKTIKSFSMAAPIQYGFIHVSTPEPMNGDTLCSWAVVKSCHIISRGQGNLYEAVLACAKVPTAVAVCAQNLIISTVTLPTKNQSQRRTAIPYAIQNQLAAPAKDNHWSWLANGQVLKLVGISHTQLAALNTTFTQLKFSPKWLVADALHLGGTDRQWQLLVTPNTWLLQQGQHCACTINNAAPLVWLQKAYDEALRSTNSAAHNAGIKVTGPMTPELAQWLTINNIPNDVDSRAERNSAAVLAIHFNPKTCINMWPVTLHHNWLPKINWPLWRLPYGLAVLLALLGLSHLWLSNAATQQQIEANHKQGQAIFRKALPNARVVDPLSQLQALVLEAQVPKNPVLFLPMLHAFQELWKTQQTSNPTTIESLEFTDNQLDISLKGSQNAIQNWSQNTALNRHLQYSAQRPKQLNDTDSWSVLVTLAQQESK